MLLIVEILRVCKITLSFLMVSLDFNGTVSLLKSFFKKAAIISTRLEPICNIGGTIDAWMYDAKVKKFKRKISLDSV